MIWTINSTLYLNHEPIKKAAKEAGELQDNHYISNVGAHSTGSDFHYTERIRDEACHRRLK